MPAGFCCGRPNKPPGSSGSSPPVSTDHRDPDLIKHPVEDLISQWVYALALGYEDLNDHDALRHDPLLAVLVGKGDPLGREAIGVRTSAAFRRSLINLTNPSGDGRAAAGVAGVKRRRFRSRLPARPGLPRSPRRSRG